MPPTEEIQSLRTAEGINTIMFDVSKKEKLNMNNGLHEWTKRLRNSWQLVTNQSEITLKRLKEAKLFIMCGPREKFSSAECEALKQYVEDSGGSLMVMLGEGGENKYQTNINYLLEQFGIMYETDSVIRTSYYKYFHPKEALIADGVLNRGLAQAAGKAVYGEETELNSQAFTFLYPYGCTLSVIKPATPVLSTGNVAFPISRPVVAFYQSRKSNGRLVVCGSVHMFHDNYFDKEENPKLIDVFLSFLCNDDVRLDGIDANDPDVTDYHSVPDIANLAEQPKGCMHESDDIPRDLTKMFDGSLFSLDLSMIPRVMQVRHPHEVNVKCSVCTGANTG